MLTPSGPEEPSPEFTKKVKRLVYSEHRRQGEYSAWHLAKKYGTTAMSLQTTNSEEMIILYPGMKVGVHNKDGMLYEVKKDSARPSDEIVGRFSIGIPGPLSASRESVVAVQPSPRAGAFGRIHLRARGQRLLLPKISMSLRHLPLPLRRRGPTRISSRFGYRYHPILKRRRP